jgi:hypothetical protein
MRNVGCQGSESTYVSRMPDFGGGVHANWMRCASRILGEEGRAESAVFGWISGQFVPDFGESLAELVELCVCSDRVFALTNEAGDQLLLLLETLIETCFV